MFIIFCASMLTKANCHNFDKPEAEAGIQISIFERARS